MLSVIAALSLNRVTLWVTARPATGAKTYCCMRAEILGALFNGLFLWVLVAFIWLEAAQRLRHPPEVRGLIVIATALVGLVVNTFSAWMTFGEARIGRAGIAVRAVFVHVVSDLIGTLGVLIAGA